MVQLMGHITNPTLLYSAAHGMFCVVLLEPPTGDGDRQGQIGRALPSEVHICNLVSCSDSWFMLWKDKCISTDRDKQVTQGMHITYIPLSCVAPKTGSSNWVWKHSLTAAMHFRAKTFYSNWFLPNSSATSGKSHIKLCIRFCKL